MTNFQLKLIALITMTIDHVAMMLISMDSIFYTPMRSIGRLSFILFAFLITEGLRHTKNKERYIATMFLFAFVIDILRQLLDLQDFPDIFYTLGLGALAIYLIKRQKNIVLQIVITLAMLYTAVAVDADYGAFGVMVIISIEFARLFVSDMKIVAPIVMAMLYYILMFVFQEPTIQMYGILSFIIIMFYNRTRGYYHPKIKYLIYVYYPFHLLILSGIAYLIYG